MSLLFYMRYVAFASLLLPVMLSAQNCVETDTVDEWILYNIPFPENVLLDRCQVVSEQVIWASDDRTFCTTHNGGCEWNVSKINLWPFNDLWYWDFSAADDMNAIAVCQDYTNQFGRVFRTQDGGTTWEETLQDGFKLPGAFIDGVHCFDAEHAVIFGDMTDGYYEIQVTEDGGDTWSRVPASNLPPQLPDEKYFWLWFYNTYEDNVWVTSEKGRCWKSEDRGLHWSVSDILPQPVTENTDLNIAFRDAQHGIAENLGLAYTTSDGGATWQPLATDYNAYNGLDAIPGSNAYHSYGASTISYDDGESWVNYPFYFEYDNGFVDFLNPQTAWSTGNINQMQKLRYKKVFAEPQLLPYAELKKEHTANHPIQVNTIFKNYLCPQGATIVNDWEIWKDGGVIDYSNSTHTLAPGEAYETVASFYLPAETGEYAVIGQATVLGSSEPVMNVVNSIIVSDSIVSKGDNSAEDIYGASNTWYPATSYELANPDTLSALSAYYTGIDTFSGNSIYCDLVFSVYEFETPTSTPGDEIWHSDTIDLSEANVDSWVAYTVPGGLPLAPGKYLFGLKFLCPGTDIYNYVGLDINHRDPGAWYFEDGEWYFDDFLGNYMAMMMKMHFGEVSADIPDATQTPAAQDYFIEVFPNPTTGKAFLTGSAETGKTYQVEIINLLGKVLTRENMLTDEQGNFTKLVDLTTSPAGTYIVKVSNEHHSWVSKVQKI